MFRSVCAQCASSYLVSPSYPSIISSWQESAVTTWRPSFLGRSWRSCFATWQKPLLSLWGLQKEAQEVSALAATCRWKPRIQVFWKQQVFCNFWKKTTLCNLGLEATGGNCSKSSKNSDNSDAAALATMKQIQVVAEQPAITQINWGYNHDNEHMIGLWKVDTNFH